MSGLIRAAHCPQSGAAHCPQSGEPAIAIPAIPIASSCFVASLLPSRLSDPATIDSPTLRFGFRSMLLERLDCGARWSTVDESFSSVTMHYHAVYAPVVQNDRGRWHGSATSGAS
jgi:hypothetical protein